MRQNREFHIKNEVPRRRNAPYVFWAGVLIVGVIVFTAVRSSFTGGRDDGPLGGGPSAAVTPSSAAPSASPAERANPYAGAAWFADPDGLLAVVDRTTSLPRRFVPPDLVSLSAHGVPARPDTLKARRVIIDDLKAMFAAGKTAGFDYYVFSSYRSYDAQASLFTYWVNKLGRKEAERSSAAAGHSEHQLGTTLDISAEGVTGDVFEVFGGTPAGQWLAANAWRFGFVMSYPPDTEETTGYQFEPWHFRYVGREPAALIHERGAIPSVFIRELDRLRRNLHDENREK